MQTQQSAAFSNSRRETAGAAEDQRRKECRRGADGEAPGPVWKI